MTGWCVWWKCWVACLFFEESQQPTWPHDRQRRRCAQVSPICRHSWQPVLPGVTSCVVFRCEQVLDFVTALAHPFASDAGSKPQDARFELDGLRREDNPERGGPATASVL